MAVKLDVAAQDLRSYDKGDIVSIVPDGAQCSGDPKFICIEIIDATTEQAQHYIEGWQIDFRHVFVNENAAGWRYRVEVDPAYINASELGKAELKISMKDHVEGSSEYWEGCNVVNFKVNSMTVDIPKNGPYQTSSGLSDLDFLKLLKSDFSDIFKTVLKIRRYHMSESQVDMVISLGGYLDITKAQALNNILDRLDE